MAKLLQCARARIIAISQRSLQNGGRSCPSRKRNSTVSEQGWQRSNIQECMLDVKFGIIDTFVANKVIFYNRYPDYKYCPTKKDTNRKRRKYSRKTQSKFTSRKEENNRIMEMLYENPKSYKTSAPSLSPSNGMATQQTTPTLLECSVDSPSELSSCYSIPSPNIPEMPLTDEQSVVVKEEDIATGNQVYQETFHDLLDFSSQCAVYDNTMLTWLHESIYSSAGYAPNHPATPLYINPQLLTLNTSSQFEET